MEGTGAITEYMNVAQLTVYGFWIFLAGLIYYLRREDKREGYPLAADTNETIGNVRIERYGLPEPPAPKTFKLQDGRTIEVPRREKVDYELRAQKVAPWDGAPFEPTGNPMRDGVGPAAWAVRDDEPELTYQGRQKIVPLRAANELSVGGDPAIVMYLPHIDHDPRGYPVIGCDGVQAGTVRDVWADRAEMRVMYLEADIRGSDRVLIPINFCNIVAGETCWEYERRVKVEAITASQFSGVPRLSEADRISPQEEDRICAYYGGGTLFAVPGRRECTL